MLLSKEINGYNRSADYICSMLKQGDCNNILTSEYSQLLGLISWAEIGFSYFVFNLLVILFKILFGNPDAKFKITIFSNPHCSPCRKMHTRVKALYNTYFLHSLYLTKVNI
ncbi:thioredoxin domain-containing protein [uncultured Parabacteroides sp.]|uniref:thioredoxin domain-containing protein n=1 Tax=Parabacteroides goldsteinii TaxID=328812 RepID=UPI00338FA1A5